MTTSTHLCPHGTNIYETSCTRCDYDRRQFTTANEAYRAVSHALNGGGEPRIFGSVVAREHPYLTEKLAEAVAIGVLARTYATVCATAITLARTDPHPEHDGRLSCGTVVGAMRTLGIRAEDEPIAAVKYWTDKIYSEGY